MIEKELTRRAASGWQSSGTPKKSMGDSPKRHQCPTYVSKNLQSASLHTTLTVDKACPGVGAPVTGKSDVVPLAGGGGGLPLSITLDVKWTGLGVTSTGRDRSSLECLDYSTQLNNISHSTVATASGSVSGLSGSFGTDLAAVSSNDAHLSIRGTPPPACFGV
jgi:hypothetical protein